MQEPLIIFSIVLFSIGLAGVLFNRSNFISVLISIEIMFIGVFAAFSFLAAAIGSTDGMVMAFIVLAAAAVHAAIGLAVFYIYNQKRHNIDADTADELRG